MKPITITEAPHGCLMRIGEYEPGNGTSYKAIVVKFPFNSSFNVMGRVSDGWLVVNCSGVDHFLLLSALILQPC